MAPGGYEHDIRSWGHLICHLIGQHVLGESAEKHYGCHLSIGPPTDNGFFYEMAIDGRAVANADYPVLEKLSEGAIKEKQKFERIVVLKETLLKMFEVARLACHETHRTRLLGAILSCKILVLI